MKGIKDSVEVSTPSLHKHNFTHTINTTFDFFQFRPVYFAEMYPKDEKKVSVHDYFRADPLSGACYGRFKKHYAAFFVPHRIVFKSWEKFLTGGSSGKLTISYPRVTLQDFVDIATALKDKIDSFDPVAQLSQLRNAQAVYRNMIDYWQDLGIPCDFFYNLTTEQATAKLRDDLGAFPVPLDPFLVCRLIWFYWFRDQNLIGDDVKDWYCPPDLTGLIAQSSEANDYLSFSADDATLLGPLPIGVEKDYFTTAFLEPQRGGAAFVPVTLPSADLNPGMTGASAQGVYANATTDKVGIGAVKVTQLDTTNIIGMFDYNATRMAKALQTYLEKNNVAGGAALQQLLAHWGIAPNPAVFQYPVYIGKFDDDIVLSEVTSPMDSADSVAGQVSTKLNGSGNGAFEYKATEHGYLVIIQYARPENSYVSGFPRERLHGVLGNGRFDFFTSEFEPTGNQPQYIYELTSAIFLKVNQNIALDAPRGFVPRYAETKRSYNRYTGQLALKMNKDTRITRDFGDITLDSAELYINNQFTMVYGYPEDLQYDGIFADVNPSLDHFEGWIHFDVECLSERNEYAAPLIVNNKGNNVSLPLAGVRM